MKKLLLLLFIPLVFACIDENPKENTIEFINSQENIDRGYPFSEASVVNGIIYLSGEIGTLPDGSLIAGGIVQETRQTLTNIKNKLEFLNSRKYNLFSLIKS